MCKGISSNSKAIALAVITALSTLSLANPNLAPGVWTNIGTPETFNLSGTFGTPFVGLDPSHTDTLYVCADQRGLWRSYNAGETWSRVGTPPTSSCDYKDTVSYLDGPIRVVVDPNNPLHLFATQGVRGCTQGFWITMNGGATWIRNKSYRDACKEATALAMDNTGMDVDPTDFNHVLISFHYYWGSGTGSSGIFETKDGGATWIIHQPPPGQCCASKGVNFLYNPGLGIGNANTWLVSTDATDYWRTTDGGKTWTVVSTEDPPHGGIANVYYSKTGVLYAGCTGSLLRSTDNGATWTKLQNTGLSGWVYGTMGDGNLLYAHQATTGASAGFWYVSPETEGITWKQYSYKGAPPQNTPAGPFMMAFDKVHRILYAGCWTTGVWALKVDSGTAEVRERPDTRTSRVSSASTLSVSLVGTNGLPVNHATGHIREVFDIRGRLLYNRHNANDIRLVTPQVVIVRKK